jgi:L,D-transpeptidase catalytic domain
MASNGSTSPRRRLRRRPLALVAALLAAGAGLAYAGLTAGDPDVSPVAGALVEAWGLESSGATAGEPAPIEAAPTSPTDVAAAAHRAGVQLSHQAEAVELRQLKDALADARHDGGAPIAVVEKPTELRSSPGGRVHERVGTETEFGSPRVQAVVGHERDWLEVIAAELPNGETAWVRADDVTVGGIDYALRASLDRRTLEVLRDGRVIRRVTIAVGGPATPTPTGSFAVTDKVRMTDVGSTYGCCALALTGHQPTVPQGWSGGDRLAIHGTINEATVGQAVSLGCFRAADADMNWLVDRVPLGTTIEIEP